MKTAQLLQFLLSDLLPKTLPGIGLKVEPHALSWHRSQALSECLGGSATKPLGSSGLDEQDPRWDLKEMMSFISPWCLPDYVSKPESTGFVWLLA